MKTKILLFAAATALIVNSCTTDREQEEVQKPVSEKLDLDALKANKNQEESSKVGDSIYGPSHQVIIIDPSTGPDPTINPTDPNEGDPKDVVPPRR